MVTGQSESGNSMVSNFRTKSSNFRTKSGKTQFRVGKDFM